ncbi:MAG: DNA gyrase inhibitor YacG [Gammaproteobacteria bacterium]|nr:DNA gyrase inhibitor YacG [Gammaproteobacteria bacterium]
MTEKAGQLTVKCPQCGKPVYWTGEFPHKPFCCERCKLIDLGAWAAEENTIPGEEIAADNDNSGYYQ